MARSRSKNSKNKTIKTYKQTRAYTKPRTTKPRLRSAFDQKIDTYNNRFVEDRRLYSPAPYRPKTRSNTPARITVVSKPAPSGKQNNVITTRTQQQFVAPERVIRCVRRKQRKEVMHALKHSGKSGQKRPTRNQYSNVKC